MTWDHKDVWRRHGKDFLVTIEHFTVELREEAACYDSDQGHRWCVYAYVYPKHPHFAEFDGPQMWQDAATMMPFHGGPSLLRWHRDDDGKPTSVQVGADYNHLHDYRFTQMATQQDAYAVFSDADELFDWLAAAGVSD